MSSLVCFRCRKLITLAVLASVGVWYTTAWPQTAPAGTTGPTMVITASPAPSTLPAATARAAGVTVTTPATSPVIPPSSALPTPALTPSVVLPPATSTAGELPAVTQPFVASITADKVYVRSGPDTKYYEIGQLTKGDLVYVVGVNKSWYAILPPNGTFGMIAKEYVELDNGSTTGTVKGDYVNVRTGTSNKDRDPSAVMTVVRKGTAVKILGATEKYYQIAPPEGGKVYVSGQFVKAAAGAEYKVAQLKLPVGAAGPTGVTVEAPTTLPTVVVVPTPGPVTPTTVPAGGGTGGTVVVATQPVLPPLVPAVQFSETATSRFKEANAKYQEEAKKTLADQNVEGLLKEFKDILAMENVSPSVKEGSKAVVAAIERTLTVQKQMKEQVAAMELTQKQREALRQQYEAAEKAIAAARESGPYVAQGILRTSTIVTGKYALVNPQTERVVAYVDPGTAAVDIGSLVGKYVGVRGVSKKMEGSDVTVIQVSNATLMAPPK